ncbi:MAG: helix-turn-helix domain-containing protein [Planctomycetia bacterium]
MRTFDFSDDEVAAIYEDRLTHPSVAVRRKLDVLALKSKGLSHVEIARLTNNSRRTVQRHLDEFLADGLAGVVAVRPAPIKGELHRYEDILRDYFLEHPPATVKQARSDVARLTGLERGPTRIRAFLKKLSICVGERPAPFRPRPTRPSSANSSTKS